MQSGLKIPKLIRWIFVIGVIFLVMMTVLRVCLFFVFGTQGNHFTDVLPAFILGLRYDLRVVCILGLILLIMGSIPSLHPFRSSRGKKLSLFIVALAGFLLFFFYIVDFAHYSYLNQRLNASVLNYLGDLSISGKMVWQTYPVIRILVGIVVGVWLLSWLTRRIYRKIQKSSSSANKPSRVIWFIAALLVMAFAIFGRAGQYPLRWSDAFALGDDYKANLSLNPFQSFVSSLKFVHSKFNIEKVKAAFPTLSGYYRFNPADSSIPNFKRTVQQRAGAITSTPNVVVVICESFSAYKSSMWGNPLNTTPFFKSMCDNGVFFDHCFTPSYGTARGVWAVVTGIPDIEIATTTSSRNPAAVDQHTIIDDFDNYEKFYFIGGSTSWANIRGLLTNNIRGLHLFEQQDYDAPKVDVWGVSDKNLFLEANKILAKQAHPFFAVIQTADNHRPYTIPAEDKNAFQSITMPTDSLNKFGFQSNEEMNAFRYTDFSYRTFIEAAKAQSYFDNTIFLFVGDHGIAGDASAMFPKVWTEDRLTMEHVPMLIYAPKLLSPKRISALCSQTDVLPTLAGLCNIRYTNSALGRDILDTSWYAKNAISFVYDPDQGYIGTLSGDLLYRRNLKSGKEELVSTINDHPVPQDSSTTIRLRTLTEGIFETAKFMVLNNKK